MFPRQSGRGSYAYQKSSGAPFVRSGRGAAAVGKNRTWVRPKEDDEHILNDHANSFAVRVPSTEVLLLGNSKVDQGSQRDSSKSGPILKGPTKRKYMASNKSHVWKRSSENDAIMVKGTKDTEPTLELPSLHDRTEENPVLTKRGNNKLILTSTVPAGRIRFDAIDEQFHEETKNTADTIVLEQQLKEKILMKRVGSNKLISGKRTEQEQPPPPEMLEPISVKFAGARERSRNELPMEKRGRHKLILSRPQTESLSDFPPRSPLLEAERPFEVHSELIHGKQGRNKLFLITKGSPDMENKLNEPEDITKHKRHHFRQGGLTESSRGKRRGVGSSGVKRIKLSAVTADCRGTDGDLEQPIVTPTDLSASLNSTSDKFTEFAYRKTSAVSQRGRGRGHGRTNMGLVRVEPDAATTPICPTFLRGMDCTNEKCTKRHDVPKEAATPICSFFQRHGQCMKRDTCPFRHIKVNPHATICPSFSLLGFCEDKDCLMKHVRQSNKKSMTRYGSNTDS